MLQFDLLARRIEREERLLAMHGGGVNKTLLDISTEGGRNDARFLLERGANANHGRAHGWPVLSTAAAKGHLAVVEALLDAGAGELGWALGDAAAKGNTAVAALLLDRGVDLHGDDVSALWCAAHNGHLEMATLLLDRDADPNVHPWWIMSPVEEAEFRGHDEIVELLLARGAVDDAA